MKSFAKYCLPVLATALLAGCGGGGGGDGHGAFTPNTSGRIQAVAMTTTLPVNPTASTPAPGGPFTTEVDITLHGRDGSLITDVDTVNVSINPVSVATFSTLDDPSTKDVNEITQRWGQAPVDVVAGKATVFVTSYVNSGTAILTVTAPPAGDLNFKQATVTFTVSGTGNVPANVQLTGSASSAYLASSGGRSQVPLTALVSNASNEVLPDTDANNVLFQVLGDAANGSVKAGSGSAGQQVAVKTVHGVANATFIAGTTRGTISIQATADGADNNVDNGISQPVSDTFDVVVSDGKLYALEITSPVFALKLPGITINSLPVSDDTQPATASSIPPDPDATLSLTVSALATDRQGNPVLPGTQIHFGALDEPVWPFNATGTFTDCAGDTHPIGNTFEMAGCDGDPKEGGSLFTAPTADFTIAGAGQGAGPGDALVVFGKALQGNADLESAVTVTSVNNATDLSVSPDFNLNDTTGSSVDYGPHLPYLVGRAMHGNITAGAPTNNAGVASVKLNYTVNTVGHAVAIWAQGSGANNKRVTDALTMTYPGVAPATLYANPDPIPGNTTTTVTVCLIDAIGVRLQGFPVSFAFQLTGGGTGSVDGTANSGQLAHVTGADGCVDAQVKTSGLPAAASGGNSGTLSFSAAGATASVDILVQVGFLSASGQVCSADGDASATPPVAPSPAAISITVYSSSGARLPGVDVSASCDSGITITPATATTDGGGQALFQAIAPDGISGTCTFTTANGRSVQKTVQGSGGSFSPPCP